MKAFIVIVSHIYSPELFDLNERFRFLSPARSSL